jgi:predicted GTPase
MSSTILVIGPAGSGKSSAINLFLGEEKAEIGSDLDISTKSLSDYTYGDVAQ